MSDNFVLQAKPGTYALVLRSRRRMSARIGRWGQLDVRSGYYLYVGSAFGPGGVLARVTRHCRENKPKRWHIDYLRDVATPLAAWCSYAPVKHEHQWAQALEKFPGITPVRDFGCSDCQCTAHLFFTKRKPVLSEYSGVLAGPIFTWKYQPGSGELNS